MRFARSSALVNVLEVDPDLVEGLDEPRAEVARSQGRARLVTLAKGQWSSSSEERETVFLVLEGYLYRLLELGNRRSAELLGAGDIIRPFGSAPDGYEMVPFEVTWTVLEDAWLAALDARFLRQMGEHPEVIERLLGRAVRRSWDLALRLTLVQMRLSAGLHFLLWQLADRFGRVEGRGVLLPVALTQARLAELISAQRASVAGALKELEAEGLITRLPRSRFLLHGAAPSAPDSPERRERGAYM